jgi:hypothetical protein
MGVPAAVFEVDGGFHLRRGGGCDFFYAEDAESAEESLGLFSSPEPTAEEN